MRIESLMEKLITQLSHKAFFIYAGNGPDSNDKE